MDHQPEGELASLSPVVQGDEYEAGQVGCSAVVAGLLLTGVLVENQYPLWILPLWAGLYGVYRSVATTAKLAGCPGCGRPLRFDSDVALCRDCLEYSRVQGDRLVAIESDHEASGSGYELSLDMLGPVGESIHLPWGPRCCACEDPAVTAIELRPASVAAEVLGGAMQQVVTVAASFPCCDRHRGAVWTDGGALRFRHYRSWRELLDAHR